MMISMRRIFLVSGAVFMLLFASILTIAITPEKIQPQSNTAEYIGIAAKENEDIYCCCPIFHITLPPGYLLVGKPAGVPPRFKLIRGYFIPIVNNYEGKSIGFLIGTIQRL